MNSETSVSKEYLETILDKAETHSAQFWRKELVISYKLDSGFTILGRAACVDPNNFSYDVGAEICREDAISQLWALEDYVLQLKLAGQVTDNRSNPLESDKR
ncbi:hypothetical protein Lepto7375DRAFT_7230 [Leptolyngbya sp. PCC 7375]|nr:hypothetical protein Lepto7375DRAFT_7230 [Leptolyngbya sp. PCC 7375]